MSRLLVLSDGSGDPPDSCFQPDDAGNLPTCTDVGGTWHPVYDDGMSSGDGVPGAFVFFFVLVVMLGVAGTIWRVTTAQRMARDAGMSESDATAMALLSDDGLEATYLASNLRTPAAEPDAALAPPVPATGTAAARLQELRHLREQELITAEEYEARRTAIIDSV
ncbi:hypothetical protein ASC77_04175 [Nocardioides sp. Root1257]|uniref:SHOCT domain-containing protein n=1 Tax=unclassified Nocardioides TaxID=2615069 RepID=UPI0006FD5277|nr:MULTISPECIES: SHOCT domain-containing protein [unclassified Nocardioides]KQW53486.1 hypothetical protein ASC77_04175 [Nocardioides sp. Root1257]KRC56172.1 hypothetical protein ASE24_04175 [Nocardioides sp. Root224]